MTERALCTLIVRSIRASGGQAWKIPDDRLGPSASKPFDGFGVVGRRPLYWEAKMVKGGRPRLPPSRLKPHQLEALRACASIPDAIVWVVVGHQPEPGARVSVYVMTLEEIERRARPSVRLVDALTDLTICA